MKLKILFDKDTKNKKLHTGWGISFLVDEKILFDAGEKGSWLIENMKNLNVDIDKIETIVISHDHWDHRGGLWSILKENSNPKVYVCPNFSKRFTNKVKSYGVQLAEAGKFTPISKNVYTTGEIEGRYAFRYMPEQALILEAREGLTLLTGCAHPGIIKIIENVKQHISSNVYLILGGFHLMGKHKKTIEPIVDKFKQLGIKKVAPSHCTGKNATKIFRKAYGGNFLEVEVGQIIEI